MKLSIRHNPIKIISFLLLIELIIPVNGFSRDLKTELDNYLNNQPAKRNISIYLETLKSGQKYLKDPAKVVPAASIIKIPVMVEVIEQVKAKKIKFPDTLTLTNKDKVPGSGILKDYKNNTKISIEKLIYLMITESDNTATNMLINKVGMDSINQRMKNLGLKNTDLQLLIMDLKAYRQGKDNKTTATDMGLLLKKIYKHQLATPELCSFMIEVLKKNKNNNAIAKFIKGVSIAHKTGSLAGIQGDVGIILGPTPYILCVFVQGLSVTNAEKIIAEISRISFESVKYSHP